MDPPITCRDWLTDSTFRPRTISNPLSQVGPTSHYFSVRSPHRSLANCANRSNTAKAVYASLSEIPEPPVGSGIPPVFEEAHVAKEFFLDRFHLLTKNEVFNLLSAARR